ncbi:MAG: hypothetical protein NT040_08955 [Bacteroidetes bacterium]|nr:hypothetical protein [Bacteroidota bacterium]
MYPPGHVTGWIPLSWRARVPAHATPVIIISHGMNNIDPSVSYYESAKANTFPGRGLSV